MPSNYTIAKTLQRVAYYKEICGHSAGKYPGTVLEVQGLVGQRLDQLEDQSVENISSVISEADDEVSRTIWEILNERPVTALQPDAVPVSILEITEVKGLGAKTAKRVYEELRVVDLAGLKAAADDGSLAKVKGFGPKLIEKIHAHAEKAAKKGS